MKAKKLLSVLLCLVMMLALAVPAFAAKSTTSVFTDTKGNWAEHEIALVADAGIVGGYPDGSFRPNNNITREAFAKVVSNFMGYTEDDEVSLAQYTDVDPNGNLSCYVARCVGNGVMSGFSDTRMAPKNNITREQAAAMLRRAFKLSTDDVVCGFTDKDSITVKLQPEVAALELTGLITGYADGTFRPKANLTRAQMMVIISRLLADNSGKFMSLSAKAGGDALTMTYEMLDDYTSQIFIPKGTVSTETVTVSLDIDAIPGLQGLSALGIDPGELIGEITEEIPTGIDETFTPEEIFPAAYDFRFATLKASVNGKAVTYNLYGKQLDNGTAITMTPTKAVEADAATMELLNLQNIMLNLFLKGNSVTLANGSYIQVGDEKIGFKEGITKNLVLPADASEEELTQIVLDTLDFSEGVASDGNQVTVVIKKGTGITTEEGTLSLNKNVTITFNGLNQDVNGMLSKLSEMSELNESNINMLIALANDLVASMNGHVAYANVTLK